MKRFFKQIVAGVAGGVVIGVAGLVLYGVANAIVWIIELVKLEEMLNNIQWILCGMILCALIQLVGAFVLWLLNIRTRRTRRTRRKVRAQQEDDYPEEDDSTEEEEEFTVY